MTANAIARSSSTASCWSRSASRSARTWRASTRARRGFAQRLLGPLERLLYRVAGVKPDEEHELEALRGRRARLQPPRHPRRVRAPAPAGRAAAQPGRPRPPSTRASRSTPRSASRTNTNWQAYGGETTMSYLTQMLALTRAELRVGGDRHGGAGRADPRLRAASTPTASATSGSTSRAATLYILLPLSVVLALLLVSQGVRADLRRHETRRCSLQPTSTADGRHAGDAEQTLALGPVASQVAIKQLGTNGGGFYNVNSAHPFENPTPLSNFLEVLAILLIPAALCFTFGAMVRDRAPGLGAARRDARDLRPAPRARAFSRADAGNPVLTHARRRSGAERAASRRQHGGQGGPLRHRQQRAVGDRDHGGVQRLGQLDARQLHAARRPGADVADAARRGRRSAASAPASTAC